MYSSRGNSNRSRRTCRKCRKKDCKKETVGKTTPIPTKQNNKTTITTKRN